MPLPVRTRTGARAPWASAGTAERGQSLVEFALIIPLFMVLLVSMFEFAFVLNAQLNTNYASRGAGVIAAQVGNVVAADCLILNEVESKVTAPAERAQITRVDVQRTNPSGSTVYATSSYQRSGTMTCPLGGSTLSVPYSATSNGYPPSERCTVLPPSGCTTMSPPRTTVDTIAVQITYVYRWRTPLPSLLSLINGSLGGTGFTFVERNVFRMEPTL